jgi:hypothetical protein
MGTVTETEEIISRLYTIYDIVPKEITIPLN